MRCATLQCSAVLRRSTPRAPPPAGRHRCQDGVELRQHGGRVQRQRLQGGMCGGAHVLGGVAGCCPHQRLRHDLLHRLSC